jgi:hypothetical protein
MIRTFHVLTHIDKKKPGTPRRLGRIVQGRPIFFQPGTEPDATPVALKATALKLGKRRLGFFHATTASSHLARKAQSISG